MPMFAASFTDWMIFTVYIVGVIACPVIYGWTLGDRSSKFDADNIIKEWLPLAGLSLLWPSVLAFGIAGFAIFGVGELIGGIFWLLGVLGNSIAITIKKCRQKKRGRQS